MSKSAEQDQGDSTDLDARIAALHAENRRLRRLIEAQRENRDLHRARARSLQVEELEE